MNNPVKKEERDSLSRAEIRNLQEIEGNPLTAEDEEMHEMFEEKGWSIERRIAYLRDKIQQRKGSPK